MGLTMSMPDPLEQGVRRNSVPGVHAEFRVYRTSDGHLCKEGDPEAAFLAYAVGQLLPVGAEEQAYHRLAHPEAPDPEKMADPAANKMRTTTRNKGA